MVVEMSSYIMLFLEQKASTANVSKSLSETVVKNRHRTNAISLSGQFITCIAGGWYIFMGLIITYITRSEKSREIAALFRVSQFGVIPAIEIYTSPPLTRFVKGIFK
jgi:hypothetical protein